MPYECFTDDGAAPVVLATNLETGDVIGVCPDHLVDYAVGLLESVTGVTWRPEVGSTPHHETGDESDEDDAADPAAPLTVAPTAPGNDDDDQADDDESDPGAYERHVRIVNGEATPEDWAAEAGARA